MCHFVTLVVPTDDTVAVEAVMARHGRAAEPIDNPSVAKALLPGERQFLTTRGHCDCGTVLAQGRETADEAEARLAKEADRLAAKGWSPTKVARAMEVRRRRAADPPARRGEDSLELWSAIVCDLRQALRAPRVGLLVHFYSGAVASEVFAVRRRTVGRASAATVGPLEEGELAIFT